MMILDNFCFRDLSPKGHLGRQEGRFPIDDDTGVILMESPDIQDNIIDHSEQLLLKKYCRKTALTACSSRFFSVRNMGFLHDIDGVGVGSDTLRLVISHVLMTRQDPG